MPGFLGGSSAGSGGTGGEILFPKEFIDPVTKLRVSQPENLIDTDFEYGLQPTKWETVELINNTPSFFSKSGDTTIDGIQSVITNNGTREITVTTGLDHGLAVGIPINVTGTKSVTADGSYIINSIPNSRTFTYLCRDNQIGDNSIEDLYTSIITGEFFQGSQIRVATAEGVVTDGEPISTLTVRTDSTHGFGTSTPFYFLNLNSTISQEFEAANTAAKSFDSSNSATAQTFDGSNTLSSFNIDWSNSGTIGGVTSIVASVSTTNNTITTSHAAETFNNSPLGTPLYYDVNTSTGFFATNPRGVVFLKTTSGLGPSQSTFQVSAVPDGEPINIEASMSGTFQLANQARTFAGNNVNPLTQLDLTVLKDPAVIFDGGNQGFAGTETNGLANIEGYSGTILVSTPPGAGLDYYQGAMVRYNTTGSAATGLVNNRTYFIDTFVANPTPNLYNVTLKELPDSASGIAPTGGSGTQTLLKIGVSTDKDIVHVRNANFSVRDMLEYSFPEGGRFTAESSAQNKLFYFVQKAYDVHNYELSESFFEPLAATGGVTTDITVRGSTYRVHTFTAVGNSTFNVTNTGTLGQVEYLVVAGGGGGGTVNGDNGGGGGGGGGVRTGILQVSSTGAITVTVGGGGQSLDTASTEALTRGGSSSVGSIVSNGGGGGGGYLNYNAQPNVNAAFAGYTGGSSGGSSVNQNPIAPSPSGQGFIGGFGRNGWGGGGGGGGGGAGGAGVDTATGLAGVGGPGFISLINGVRTLYASGGGAGGSTGRQVNADRAGFGGIGGGGGGRGASHIVNSSAGAANTGGGGGGGGGGATGGTFRLASPGGSGIVILRYPITLPAPVPAVATGGAITTSVIGDTTYRVHTFTATGSSSFVVSNPGNLGPAEYLIVGGGGGGATDLEVGGAGGGGGFLTGSLFLNAQTYPVVVGAGGASGTGPDSQAGGGTNGTNGGNSSVFGLTALGGGGGGTRSQVGRNGASGGGSGDFGGGPGLGTVGQGFDAFGAGTANDPSSILDTGGGGGAGGRAGSPNRWSPGPGRFSDIANATFGRGGNVAGDGGAVVGAANTGNGGSSARAGGSGIVVIRYPIEITGL
jgi:hypothetical protein